MAAFRMHYSPLSTTTCLHGLYRPSMQVISRSLRIARQNDTLVYLSGFITETTRPRPIEGNLASNMNSLMESDPNGDVLLECKDQNNDTLTTFRVSSKVLQLASPVFAGMFGPHFREGQLLQQGESPAIRLEEDDASLMSIILDILRFRGGGKNEKMGAERLARLTIRCDKYDLAKAVGPWVLVWFENVKRAIETSGVLGFMLLAAHLFDNCGEFQEMSEMALKILPLGFEEDWESQELSALLPIGIQG